MKLLLKLKNKGSSPSGIGYLSQVWLSCAYALIIWLSDLLTLNVLDEGNSRNVSVVLN